MLSFERLQPQDTDPAAGATISPKAVEEIFSDCADLIAREVSAGDSGVTLRVYWLDGTVSGRDVAEQVLRPLTDPVRFGRCRTEAEAAARLEAAFVYGADTKRVTDLKELCTSLCYGGCAVVFYGFAFVCQLKSDQRRSVQEPAIEKSVKGSKDAFVESLRVNTGLLRSRLRTPALKLYQTTIGRETRTDAAVLWLEGVCPQDLPGAVTRRLDKLDVDGLLTADTLEYALADAPLSPFPQVLHTERPDTLAQALLEGRIAVLAEGLPLAFLVPAALPAFLQTAEDGAQHFLAASFLRLLRWAALGVTLLLPALYIAIAAFHPEMIPTQLLLSVIESKQSVPFSTTAEVLGMLLAFELLQEAGLRLPEPVGQTASIIGALIVGQSAVEAKVISPIAVIVVALTGIAGYTMPSQDLGAALRLSRFALALAASLAGLFGIVAGAALLLWRLCSLESFGRPYLSGADAFFRRPPWKAPAPTLRRRG